VVWGTDGVTKHGRHIFPKVPQDYWECLNCKEQFLDHEQAVREGRSTERTHQGKTRH
jgi:hypothetical protein